MWRAERGNYCYLFFCLDRWEDRYLEMLTLKRRVPLANLFFINLSTDKMKWFIESTFLLY